MDEFMTPKEIKSHMERQITNWRHIRDNASEPADETRAVHWIDALQSMYKTFFGTEYGVGE